jgi:methyl-accepting chemotaxis protein
MDTSKELKEAIDKVEAALAEARAKSAKELKGAIATGVEEAGDAIVDITEDIEEFLEKADKMVSDSRAELERARHHLKDKSIEETEKAIEKVREALEKVEELIDKIK